MGFLFAIDFLAVFVAIHCSLLWMRQSRESLSVTTSVIKEPGARGMIHCPTDLCSAQAVWSNLPVSHSTQLTQSTWTCQFFYCYLIRQTGPKNYFPDLLLDCSSLALELGVVSTGKWYISTQEKQPLWGCRQEKTWIMIDYQWVWTEGKKYKSRCE